MKRLLALLLLWFTLQAAAQNFYRTYAMPLEVLSNAYHYVNCATSDGFLNVFTVYDQDVRQNILLVKMDASGAVVWTKRYNTSEENASMSVESLVLLPDDAFILGGDLIAENGSRKNQFVKFNKDGVALWVKVVDNWGGNHSAAMLSDNSILLTFNTSASEFCMMKISQEGSVLKTVKTNLVGDEAVFIHPYDGNVTLVLKDFNVVNIDNELNILNSHKRFHWEIGYATTRAANGDVVYAAATGFPAHMNVFRMNSAGTVLWSKRIETWRKGRPHGQTGDFDVVGFHALREDSEGNIECIANSEGGQQGSLCVKLSANGEYLENRKFNSTANKFTYLGAEEYYLMGRTGNSNQFRFSKHKLDDLYNCDEDLNYIISDVSNPEHSTETITLTAHTMNISSGAIIKMDEPALSLQGSCEPLVLSTTEKEERTKLLLAPNPTAGEITLQYNSETTGMLNITITSVEGKVVYAFNGTKNNFSFEHTLESGAMVPGIYFTSVSCGAQRETVKMYVK